MIITAGEVNPANPLNAQPGDTITPTGAEWPHWMLGQEYLVTHLDEDGKPRFTATSPIGFTMEDFVIDFDDTADWSAIIATRAVDMVNHPPHYTSDPSGVECIQITRHRNFNIGNAIKYLWRNGLKDDPSLGGRQKQIEDLRKSIFYIEDEIKRLEGTPE